MALITMSGEARRRTIASPLLAIVLCVLSAGATADDDRVDIGGTTLILAPPAGWCGMNANKISDARLLGILREGMERTGNTLVTAYANCDELERWRSTRQRTLNNYGIVAFENALRGFDYPGTDASFVSELRETLEAAGHEYIEDLLEHTVELVEDVLPTVTMGVPAAFGIIGEDEISLYTGAVMPIVTEFGDSKVSIYSSAISLLRGKIVYTYLYAPYEGADVATRLLDDHKQWTARLRAAN